MIYDLTDAILNAINNLRAGYDLTPDEIKQLELEGVDIDALTRPFQDS